MRGGACCRARGSMAHPHPSCPRASCKLTWPAAPRREAIEEKSARAATGCCCSAAAIAARPPSFGANTRLRQVEWGKTQVQSTPGERAGPSQHHQLQPTLPCLPEGASALLVQQRVREHTSSMQHRLQSGTPFRSRAQRCRCIRRRARVCHGRADAGCCGSQAGRHGCIRHTAGAAEEAQVGGAGALHQPRSNQERQAACRVGQVAHRWVAEGNSGECSTSERPAEQWLLVTSKGLT